MDAYNLLMSLCIVMFVSASVLIAWGLYTMNTHHKVIVNRVYFTDKIPAYIYVKMETEDAIVAGNPINISVTTMPIDRNRIHGIQLTFDGAEKYFPNYTKISPPPPPSSNENFDEYAKELDKYFKDLEAELNKMREEVGANILILHSDTNGIWSTYSGSINNVIYSSGGKFDIGITLTRADGGVIGYEMGNREYAIKEAINVSPPEVLIQLKNEYVMRGLGFIGIGLPFLIAGFEFLKELIKLKF